ncbi:MAG: hypothetical protein QGD89_09160 [Actinomycetota bacterium]|nr:hypothetical protein [Actinomycetota bacterium]
MNAKLEEQVKVDVGVTPTSLATTNKTGAFYAMANWARALFVVEAAAIADGQTVVAQVLQAKDGDGGSEKVITNAAATITSPTKATEVTVTATTVVDGNLITVNGQIFTCDDSSPDSALGQFDSGANDTDAMANLAVVVNLLLPKVKATSASTVLTLRARDPGEETISISDETGTMVPAVIKALAYIEVEHRFLDHDNGFDHVAIKLTTDDTIVAGATLIRGNGRFDPTQYVAASKSDVS